MSRIIKTSARMGVEVTAMPEDFKVTPWEVTGDIDYGMSHPNVF